MKVDGYEEYKIVDRDVRQAVAHTIDLLQARNESVSGAMMLGTLVQIATTVIVTTMEQIIKESGEEI